MNLRVRIPERIRQSDAMNMASRYLTIRDFAQAKQFARLARDARDPSTRDFWRTAAADMLAQARRWLAQAKAVRS